MQKRIKILAIETSCDDTCVAIIEAESSSSNEKKGASFKILSNVAQNQSDIHTKYGGVYPMMAKREHIKNIRPMYELAMEKAKNPKIDAIAVTVGPGLEPALWVGITFAKELAEKLKIPIIPVNHMEGHIFSIFPTKTKTFKVEKGKNFFPILSLLISGGHTELVLMKDWMKYKKIGETRDDAIGEAFDKVARMLGLPYPGGPEVGRLAEAERQDILLGGLGSATARARGIFQQKNIRTSQKNILSFCQRITFPRPMIHSKDYDFSFSGLKTAVLYLIRDFKEQFGEYSKKEIPNILKQKIAREFEDAAIEVIVKKTIRAMKEHKIKTFIVGGGVSANKYLRQELNSAIVNLQKETKNKIRARYPAPGLSTDNALMIAIAGYFQYKNKKYLKDFDKIKAVGNLSL